jgi:hypothetical protein
VGNLAPYKLSRDLRNPDFKQLMCINENVATIRLVHWNREGGNFWAKNGKNLEGGKVEKKRRVQSR